MIEARIAAKSQMFELAKPLSGEICSEGSNPSLSPRL